MTSGQFTRASSKRARACDYMVLSILLPLVHFAQNNRSSGIDTILSSGAETDSFDSLYRRWGGECLEKNVVMDRGDGSPEIRPWSVTGKTFQDGHHETCGSLNNLLVAVRDGRRVWGEKSIKEEAGLAAGGAVNSSIMKEAKPSYFIPNGCHLPYIGKEQACRILSRYSHVVIAGDSHARHTAQGLNMLLSGDWILGAYPRGSGLTADLMDKCRCDGQFSELKLCRKFDGHKLLPEDPRDCGTCTWLSFREAFHLHYVAIPGERDSPVWEKLCCNDPRPALIILSGGSHFESNAKYVKKKLINKMYEKLRGIKTVCQWSCNFKIVWTGLNAQSRLMDQRYPHQSRENATQFNEAVDEYVSSEFGVTPISFWNLTKDAPTSDGFHYLSDVNMYKANVLLHIARLI